VPAPRHLLHAVDEAGEARKPRLDVGVRDTDLAAGGDRGERVLGVVLTAQRTDPRQRGEPAHLALAGLLQFRAFGKQPVGERQALGDANQLGAGLFEPVGDLRAPCVVDADDRQIAAGDQPLLDRGVVLHRAVAVEMVG
jgi:hypothetical protein